MKYPSQLRHSRFSNRWVLIAESRAKRPRATHRHPASQAPRRDPFRPGKVDRKKVIDQIPNDDGTTYERPSSWKALAIPNDYPVVSSGDGHPDLTGHLRDGYGFHELVIHSPDPDRDFEDFPLAQTEAVIELYQKRYRSLIAKPHIKHVQIFTNRGNAAGASVVHPHSQIIALPISPPQIERLIHVAAAYYQKTGASLVEDEVAAVRQQAGRLVFENDYFVVFCPYAPLTEFHVRIFPKSGRSRFARLAAKERRCLADALNLTYRALDSVADIPPYNAYIRNTPAGHENIKGFRWHVDIMPHLSTPGGFELSTGVMVVTVAPETAAAKLRRALTSIIR